MEFKSSNLLVKKIPLPWQLASGFTINVLAFPFYYYSNWFLRSLYSAGRSQVWGKNLYSSGNCFFIFIKLRPKWFFLANENMPGKWLIFWLGCIYPRVSGWTALSVHITSQSVASASNCNFHLNNYLPTYLTTGYCVSNNKNQYKNSMQPRFNNSEFERKEKM